VASNSKPVSLSPGLWMTPLGSSSFSGGVSTSGSPVSSPPASGAPAPFQLLLVRRLEPDAGLRVDQALLEEQHRRVAAEAGHGLLQSGRAERERIGDALLARELPDRRRRLLGVLVLVVEAQDLEAVVLVLAVELLEHRHGRAAGRAPRSPVVDDQHVVLERRLRDVLAAERLQVEGVGLEGLRGRLGGEHREAAEHEGERAAARARRRGSHPRTRLSGSGCPKLTGGRHHRHGARR
jgi:hypothetical protein